MSVGKFGLCCNCGCPLPQVKMAAEIVWRVHGINQAGHAFATPLEPPHPWGRYMDSVVEVNFNDFGFGLIYGIVEHRYSRKFPERTEYSRLFTGCDGLLWERTINDTTGDYVDWYNPAYYDVNGNPIASSNCISGTARAFDWDWRSIPGLRYPASPPTVQIVGPQQRNRDWGAVGMEVCILTRLLNWDDAIADAREILDLFEMTPQTPSIVPVHNGSVYQDKTFGFVESADVVMIIIKWNGATTEYKGRHGLSIVSYMPFVDGVPGMAGTPRAFSEQLTHSGAAVMTAPLANIGDNNMDVNLRKVFIAGPGSVRSQARYPIEWEGDPDPFFQHHWTFCGGWPTGFPCDVFPCPTLPEPVCEQSTPLDIPIEGYVMEPPDDMAVRYLECFGIPYCGNPCAS